MMVSEEAQARAKEQRISFLLDKNGIAVTERHPLLRSPDFFGYRNRAQFKTDGRQIGFVSEGTNTLAPIDDCLVLNPPMRTLFQELRRSLPQSAWQPTGRFPWSYLDVDDRQTLKEVVPNRRLPFRQGNSAQNEQMKKWIVETLKAASRDAPIVEAFCGSGNFTEALVAAGFQQILAAEVRGSALEELRAKNMPGVRVLEINMSEKRVWSQLSREAPQARVLIVDPPREGLEERSGLFESLPLLEQIVYISCEPATWARDLKDFQKSGWKVAHLTPLDMFPHTPHVEILSLLTR
jgi:23S rRNA (uracil1939-C5)-methyltransferase